MDQNAFTYVFADVRGYGQSRDINGDYTAKEAAGDIVRLADHLEWDDFHLIGHSMTGMVVQRAAVDAVDRVKSVVALTPVPATGLQLDEQISGYIVGVVSDRKIMFDYFKMWNNTDFSQESKGLKTPILVILAEYDTEFNLGVKSFWEDWYPNCKIIECKNATHHVTEDAPVFIASAIENFISKMT